MHSLALASKALVSFPLPDAEHAWQPVQRRYKFCVWLAGMGKKGTDFEDARNAALLVWVDFSAKSDPRTEA